MWTLACDGDCLGGKRQWLRPGSESFLRRCRDKDDIKDGRCITDKSVSRSHLVIRVDSVEPGDSTRLDKRQCIRLEDNSKSGTVINGDKIVKSVIVLEPGDHTVLLGRYEGVFHFSWRPVVLSITNLSKTAKQSSDPLSGQRRLLEQAGVKLSMSYIANVTTHVIAKKRNTAMGLQALLQARWLVTDSFVENLARACHKEEGLNSEGIPYRSHLEKNLDDAWPAETDHLVPIGEEPVKRANTFLHPRPERGNVFVDMTFVFLSQAQYDTLLPVVTLGGGKAVLCQYEPEVTALREVINVIARIAGREGDKKFRLDQSPDSASIVVVRIGDTVLGRSAPFICDLDLALDQRSIEQSEFFGAVMDGDASMLRQALRDASISAEPSQVVRQTSTAADRMQTSREAGSAEGDQEEPSTSQTVQVEETAPSMSKKRVRRIVTQSRFKGFNDFDPSQIAREESSSPEPEKASQPQPYFAAPDAPDEQDGVEPNNKKRRAPADVVRDEERALLDELLPGAAALKRRRTEALKTGEKDVFARPFGDAISVAHDTQSKSKHKKSFLEKDIKAEIKKRREKEEEERRKDEESLRTALDIDISELKDLAKVETFELPVRALRPTTAEAGEVRANWNPAWNGRKNFKKFRPQGQRRSENNGYAQPTRVLVGLEEVPGQGSRSAENHWLQSNSSARSKSQSQSQSQSQPPRGTASTSRTLRHEESVADDARVGDDAFSFRRHLQRSREESAERAVHNDLPPAESTGASTGAPSPTPTSTEMSSSRTGANKRPANQPVAGAPATKRSRLGSRMMMVVSDDEEPLAFRRNRR
ncbi:uncharacterized protein K489DRAFT_375867 [Dissoconium aciculare CBS 342.82]|uniref:FHA domain-containing protein n=1 Tax=Dissoconium aciculare CBS 342.82 TaxID=1314786 RepID=A0A6J3MII1_9PEZI|nr:uncharacterized protein K489DRAFT_375867 [Dissoconium aciculare CBS 342.82]KAF1827731.1 hypothetical protein K489DRAFT_375867 [Dissoconium aciculare CBS 342.82]